MLRIRNLQAGYGKLRVLKGISLHVSPGEIVAIIGPNGAGKSTLLRSITGILRPQSGQIVFDKRDLGAATPEEIVRAGCCLVPEGRQVFSGMTVHENLVLGAYLRWGRQDRSEILGNLSAVCKLFPILAERRDQLAGTLSGGEQQMLAMGRAIMSRPKFLMLDEPSLGVAPLVVKSIFSTVAEMKSGGLTVLLVEQNARAALRLADRGYVLETGQIVLEGTSRELLNNQDVQRAYLGKEYKRIDE
jgi:branched-chain amino acid transport system ATP-binding protein